LSTILKRIAAWISPGDAGDSELGRDDLLRQIADGVGKLSRFGAKGVRLFPEEVRVQVAVGDGATAVVDQLLRDSSFDLELESRLANQFPDREGSFPLRSYEVQAGSRNQVHVAEAQQSTVVLRFDEGDQSGATIPAPVGRKLLYAGRGPWHGPGEDLRNDIILTHKLQWVPRRALRLERRGSVFIVHPLDIDDAVEVVRPDGGRVRPARMPKGTAELRLGDRLELRGRDEQLIALRLMREER
jgi:hypothetical protein